MTRPTRKSATTRRDMVRRLAQRRRGEDGFTLVEMAVTMLVLIIFLGLAVPTLDIAFSVQRQTNATYNGVNQALQISNTLSRYIRWAEEPESNGISGYFTSNTSGSQLQFYSDVGTSYASQGPALIDADNVEVASSNPPVYTLKVTVTPATNCSNTVASENNCAWTGAPIVVGTLNYVAVSAPFEYISISQPNTKLPQYSAWLACNPLVWPPPLPPQAACQTTGGAQAPVNPWTSTPGWTWSPNGNSLDDVLGVSMNLQTNPPNGAKGALVTTAFLASQNSFKH